MPSFLLYLALAGCAAAVPPARTAAPPPPLDRAGRLVHDEANAARRAASLPAVRWSARLARVAQGHSDDMAARGYFAHVSPDGTTPRERGAAGGVPCRVPLGDGEDRVGITENLFRTTRYERVVETRLEGGRAVRSVDWLTDRDVATLAVRGWLRSLGHRQNLLDRHVGAAGVGVAVGADGTVYVTHVFC